MEELILFEPNPNTCLSCDTPLSGRLGKKFCSDQCRATYHNQHKSLEEKWIHRLNKILRKNRTVLKNLNPIGQSIVRIEVLEGMGFDFRFYTHQYQTKEHTYYFCYEWGYRILENKKVNIITWQKYMDAVNVSRQQAQDQKKA